MVEFENYVQNTEVDEEVEGTETSNQKVEADVQRKGGFLLDNMDDYDISTNFENNFGGSFADSYGIKVEDLKKMTVDDLTALVKGDTETKYQIQDSDDNFVSFGSGENLQDHAVDMAFKPVEKPNNGDQTLEKMA